MINQSSFLTLFMQVFSEDQWPWMLPALRLDSQVWTYLNSDAGREALTAENAQTRCSSPAELALATLNSPLDAASLRTLPLEELTLAESDSDLTLSQAGLEALRLRELRRAKGSWESLPRELGSVSPTVLACLFGIVPDPAELLRVIVFAGGEHGVARALHALLSNPMPVEEHIQFLSHLSPGLSADKRMILLGQLASLRSDLAGALAQMFASEDPSALPIAGDGEDPRQQITALAQLVETAHVAQIAHQPEQAAEVYGQAVSAALQLQAQLLARKAYAAEAALRDDEALKAWEAAAQLVENDPEYQAGLSLALLRAGRSADAQGRLESFEAAGAHPGCLMASARLALARGNRDTAQAEAARALEMLEYTHHAGNQCVSPGCRRETDLARLLMELNEPEQALRAANLALRRMPNQAEWHSLAAAANLAARQPHQAVACAQMAVAFSPTSPVYRRQLAECLEHSGDWSAALPERIRLAQITPDELSEDELALAACALQAGQLEHAIQSSERILAEDETNGLALAILGAARGMQEGTSAAFEFLMQAVHYSSDAAFPWLALAQMYRREGMLQKAVETLQAACRAAPNQPALYLKLGDILSDLDSPSQALSALRQAFELSQATPTSHNAFLASWAGSGSALTGEPRHLIDQIALRFGQALFQLGHIEESCQALEPTFQRCHSDPEIARAYAQTLLSLGKLHEALPPLEAALLAKSLDVDTCLDHARTVLILASERNSQIQAAAALPSIRRALEMDPDQAEAQALLAEALAASGDYEPAMLAYQHAMESELVQQPAWQARLAHGLGTVALNLGQVETAVAALQEASQASPTQPVIWRSLSEAYQAAGFSDDALQAARSAVRQAPSDVETLVWFADQVLKLKETLNLPFSDVQIEAVHSLERAVQVAPQEPGLRVKLGETWMKIGQPSRAKEVLVQLANVMEVSSLATPQDLYLAARSLLKLDDPAAAIQCLERALEQNKPSQDNLQPSTQELLTDLVEAYTRKGNLQSALAALSQLIQKNPSDAMLYVKKAGLLLRLQPDVTNPDNASREEILSSVKTALEIQPDSPTLHGHAAAVFRLTGMLPEALLYADRIVQSAVASEEEKLAARSLAAESAMAMLQPELASTYLEYQPRTAESGNLQNPTVAVNYHCLRANHSLQAGNARSALTDLAAALELSPDHVQVLALQARLAHRRSDPQAARAVLKACLSAAGMQKDGLSATSGAFQPNPTELYFAAEAALELRAWEDALRLWKAVAQTAPNEPLAQLGLARALVIQAEFQRVCDELEIVQRAPGEASLSPEAFQQLEDTLAATENALRPLSISAYPEGNSTLNTLLERGIALHIKPANDQVRRWRARGMAAFQPTHESALSLAALQSDPDDAAARVACLHQLGEPGAAALAAREFPHSPQVLVQLAIALSAEKPRQAMAAIHLASDLLTQNSETTAEHPDTFADIAPLVNVLIARLFHRYGNRATDRQHALDAIEEALAMWNDEPRWHVLAAEILVIPGQTTFPLEIDTAIDHLLTATRLSPADPQPDLSLGKIYLKSASFAEAVGSFQRAVEKAPAQSTAWMGLARAQSAAGDLEQAASSADQAVILAPEQVEPVLLRGEIALLAKNPHEAHSQAQIALRLNPEEPQALLLMARTLNALERPEEALQMLEKVLPLCPNPLPLSRERVRLLSQSKGLEIAVLAAQELANQYPEDAGVLALLAEMMDKAGDSEKAIRSAQKALKSSNQTEALPEGEQANLHFLLGKLFRRSGQLDQAVYHLSETVQLAPDKVEAYLELGQAHQERRQHLQAMNIFQEAIRVAPRDHRPYYQVGLALKESKDYMGAERMLRQAADLAPEDLSIHRLLAAVVALNLVHNRRDAARETALGRFS